jgi:predicted HAD superfamily Cof-like phosphohydrolase
MNAAGQTTTINNSEQAQLYKDLIKEEVCEFWEAEAVLDDVEEIDACFDMIWVIVGYMLSRGWDCNKIWDEGSLSNLRKIDKKPNRDIRLFLLFFIRPSFHFI